MPWFEDPKERYEAAPFLTALREGVEHWPTPEAVPRFLVAFSGGVDSTVLLAALARLGLGVRLRAAHVDHALNPDSAAWAAQCAAVAAGLGVAFESVRVKVEGIADHGLEAAARDARYAALRTLLAPGEVLLTATIRNRAAVTQELPLLELTLTDVLNQTTARKVFYPADYLDKSQDQAQGIASNQEVPVNLYLDTANIKPAGYRLYLFFA